MTMKKRLKEIEVDLLGNGSRENPYRPNLPHRYFRYINDEETLKNIDKKSKKVKVYFTKEVETTNAQIYGQQDC